MFWCDVGDDKRRYAMKAGGFGAGVAATFKNDPQTTGYAVFKNCPYSSSECTAEHKVDCTLTPTLRVFLKVMQEAPALSSNSLSAVQSLTQMEKEIRRSRAAANLVFDLGNGEYNPAFPSLYDVLHVDTNLQHSLHSVAFVQEFIDGLTADNLRVQIARDERMTVYGQLASLAWKYNRLQKNEVTREYIEKGAIRAEREFWMRKRLYLQLIDVTVEAAQKLWNGGFVHCDLHFNNIMIQRRQVTDAVELKSGMLLGNAVFPGVQAQYSLPYVDDRTNTLLMSFDRSGRSGIESYWLKPSNVRLIDVSFLLQLPGDADENAPCLFYRPSRQEDLLELWRGGMVYTLVERPDVWTSALKEVTQKIGHIWEVFVRDELQVISRLHSVFVAGDALLVETLKRIRDVQEVGGCISLAAERAKPKIASIIEDSMRRPEARNLLTSTCTLSEMKRAVLSLRRVLRNSLKVIDEHIRETHTRRVDQFG
uniref:Aminoglycoside phosphotransferase domain-containing protein n=1 Tax=Lankesteria abbotti TaxID=340204 RepID=A0A7S2VTJ3_9APIC